MRYGDKKGLYSGMGGLKRWKTRASKKPSCLDLDVRFFYESEVRGGEETKQKDLYIPADNSQNGKQASGRGKCQLHILIVISWVV